MTWEHISEPAARVIEACADAMRGDIYAGRAQCSTCRHSWMMGRTTATIVARCSCKDSPKYRRCLNVGATCALWEAKP